MKRFGRFLQNFVAVSWHRKVFEFRENNNIVVGACGRLEFRAPIEIARGEHKQVFIQL